MSFLKYLKEQLGESHYAKGHYGDPQYEQPDYISLNIPKNLYAFQIIDSDSEEIETITLLNPKLDYEFSEEDGISNIDYNDLVNGWKQDITKTIPNIINSIHKHMNDKNSMEVYKQPWFIVLLRGNDSTEDNIINGSEYEINPLKQLNPQELQIWFEKILQKDFNVFVGNDNNYKVVDIEARYAEAKAEAQLAAREAR